MVIRQNRCAICKKIFATSKDLKICSECYRDIDEASDEEEEEDEGNEEENEEESDEDE